MREGFGLLAFFFEVWRVEIASDESIRAIFAFWRMGGGGAFVKFCL